MTIFAPFFNGLSKYGVLNVASITNGTPASLAILPTRVISIISKPGLPMTSPNTIFVFGLIASAKASGSLGATNVVVIPYLESVC